MLKAHLKLKCVETNFKTLAAIQKFTKYNLEDTENGCKDSQKLKTRL